MKDAGTLLVNLHPNANIAAALSANDAIRVRLYAITGLPVTHSIGAATTLTPSRCSENVSVSRDG